MTALSSTKPSFAGYREVDELADLADILDPALHAVAWRRPIDATIQDCLARPECRFGENARIVAHAEDENLRTRIGGLLPEAAHRACPIGMNALLDDVDFLARAFSDLLAADELMVSLEAPTGASCPRFHVDRVGIRMLVTYRGPGTEILPNPFCDRAWLGPAGHGLADEESGIMRPGAEIVTVDPFSVVLLKGEAWPQAEGFGAVHRSPNPEGVERTLLRVDMLSQRPLEGSD